jgi:hypothetical protein
MDERTTRGLRVALTIASALALPLLGVGAGAATLHIGVLGDSNSDEYRADDNRGGTYASTTFNWVEILQRLRDVDVGAWGSRAEPRRTGYEYNWARSGAKAGDLPAQQVGLAQQVRDGKVQYVILHVGANDFHPASTYRDVYDGTVSGAALQQKINSIIASIRSAIDAVETAGAKVVVTSVPDAGLTPAYQITYPDAARRKVVTDAINVINSALSSDAAADANLVYSDLNVFYQQLSARIDAEVNVVVGGEKIAMLTRGNEPHHVQLDDVSGHPGTVMSALMANGIFLAALSQGFGAVVTPLTDQEMLCIANIAAAGSCPKRPNPPVLVVN